MPARWRIEGVARAGVLRAAGILERSYQILDVVGTRDAETPPDPEAVLDRWLADDTFGRFRAVDPADRGDPYGLDDRDPGDGRAAQDSVSREGGQTVHLLVPEDPGDLISSDLLPPPVWVEAPGFSTADELAVLERDLAELSLPDGNLNRFDFDTGPQLDELTRYNRAEGLAIGARAGWSRATGIGLIGLEGRGWIGIGSGQPDLRLELGLESPRHRLSLTGHHRVDDVDPRAGNLGIVNSLTAFFFGRDDGDYFRASGARLTWQPTGVRRPWWNVTLAAEEHRALPNEVDFSRGTGFSVGPGRSEATPALPPSDPASCAVVQSSRETGGRSAGPCSPTGAGPEKTSRTASTTDSCRPGPAFPFSTASSDSTSPGPFGPQAVGAWSSTSTRFSSLARQVRTHPSGCGPAPLPPPVDASTVIVAMPI